MNTLFATENDRKDVADLGTIFQSIGAENLSPSKVSKGKPQPLAANLSKKIAHEDSSFIIKQHKPRLAPRSNSPSVALQVPQKQLHPRSTKRVDKVVAFSTLSSRNLDLSSRTVQAVEQEIHERLKLDEEEQQELVGPQVSIARQSFSILPSISRYGQAPKSKHSQRTDAYLSKKPKKGIPFFCLASLCLPKRQR